MMIYLLQRMLSLYNLNSIVLCTSFVFLREQGLNIEKWKSEIPTFLLFALLNREKIESNQDIEMDRRVMGQV